MIPQSRHDFAESARGGFIVASTVSVLIDSLVPHRYGKYTWADGRVYEGQFSKDLRDGMGEMRWPDGYTYRGPHEEGTQHGVGTVVSANGEVETVEFDRGKEVSRRKKVKHLRGEATPVDNLRQRDSSNRAPLSPPSRGRLT